MIGAGPALWEQGVFMAESGIGLGSVIFRVFCFDFFLLLLFCFFFLLFYFYCIGVLPICMFV